MHGRPKKKRNVSLNSAAWRRLRAEVLADEPLCRECLSQGRIVKATDVDHITNGEGDYTDDNRRENLQPLCHECHSRKTGHEMAGTTPPMGCDLDGIPLDPAHPWRHPS